MTAAGMIEIVEDEPSSLHWKNRLHSILTQLRPNAYALHLFQINLSGGPIHHGYAKLPALNCGNIGRTMDDFEMVYCPINADHGLK